DDDRPRATRGDLRSTSGSGVYRAPAGLPLASDRYPGRDSVGARPRRQARYRTDYRPLRACDRTNGRSLPGAVPVDTSPLSHPPRLEHALVLRRLGEFKNGGLWTQWKRGSHPALLPALRHKRTIAEDIALASNDRGVTYRA